MSTRRFCSPICDICPCRFDSCHIAYFFIDVLVAVSVSVPVLVLDLAVQLVVDYDLEQLSLLLSLLFIGFAGCR